MTKNTYNKIIEMSQTKKVFSVCDKGEWIVCDDIAMLPFRSKEFGEFIDGNSEYLLEEIAKLKEQVDKQANAIKELTKIIQLLNK